MSNVIEYIKNISLFNLLQPDELKLLSSKFTSHTYKKGEAILRELEKSSGLYILIEGKVNVVLETDGIDFIVDELRSGEFFGEMALLDGKPRSASIICISDCKALKLSSEDFYEILERNPSILRSLVLELCDRLRKANDKLKEDNKTELLID